MSIYRHIGIIKCIHFRVPVMKKIFISFFFLLLFSGCDEQGAYSFIIENKTEKNITIKFHIDSSCSFGKNENEVTILSEETKTIRIIEGALNSSAHDCLEDHGLKYFNELPFDTYIDGEKIEKELWQKENWTYHKKSSWNAEYKMTITNKSFEDN